MVPTRRLTHVCFGNELGRGSQVQMFIGFWKNGYLLCWWGNKNIKDDAPGPSMLVIEWIQFLMVCVWVLKCKDGYAASWCRPKWVSVCHWPKHNLWADALETTLSGLAEILWWYETEQHTVCECGMQSCISLPCPHNLCHHVSPG